MIIRLLVFLFLNFVALGIGGFLMANGPASDWYLQLDKAPWTPPGWVFGAAWTTVMICFAVYMTFAWEHVGNRSKLLILYTIQWILNVSWNPVFFRYHLVLPGLVIIGLLTGLIAYMLFFYLRRFSFKTVFILPYFLWLLIATSLNAYILFMN